MNRCFIRRSPVTRFRRLAVALLAGCLTWAVWPAAAQVQAALGGVRTFPDSALRGQLTLLGGQEAQLNGQVVRMAPGMRLFSPQNTLVMLHTVQGQAYRVNYLIENSTGMLLTAWILSEAEAAQPRKGRDDVQINYRSAFDKTAPGEPSSPR